NGMVRNKFRLQRALPTMRYLSERGAKVIIISHIGRERTETLQPVYEELTKHLPVDWGGRVDSINFAERRKLLAEGDILLAENLRQDEREENNDFGFVGLLAGLGEIYVNDAFAEAHREHASTFGVAKILPAYAGLTLLEEVTELSKALHPKHPALFLLGGAKFETKIPLAEKYLNLYEHVFIGGALANDIFKARGLEVGKSLVSDISLKDSPILNNEKLLLPIDVIVDGPHGKLIKETNQVSSEERIMDCGPKTIDMLASYIEEASAVLWNGPFGAYEEGYVKSTEQTARHIATAKAFSVVGGGDTVAAIEKLNLNDSFGFVSIGGGSTLTFLERGSTSVIDLL
ncbi:phosphoglycerate kinase, partial [Candidatus Kaiserbacteria bacterium]|nr:phosphoglycerate kinase [Candidatus Kaiserbacteria bacterium]